MDEINVSVNTNVEFHRGYHYELLNNPPKGVNYIREPDLRIPIEFTKRGFYVVALDYQGHGESGGSLTNIDENGQGQSPAPQNRRD